MKPTLLITLATLLCATSLYASETVSHDSVYVYLTWEAMWNSAPDTVVVDPEFIPHTPYDIEIDCNDRNLNKLVKKQAVAIAIGDTLWYANSQWLKDNLSGDCKRMRNYVPLYFSSKVAFLQWAGTSISGFFYASVPNLEEYMDDPQIYVIGFEDKAVKLLDSDLLLHLLGEYPDLRRRYQSMRDYRERYMIADFFLQYVNRVNRDPDVLPLF